MISIIFPSPRRPAAFVKLFFFVEGENDFEQNN